MLADSGLVFATNGSGRRKGSIGSAQARKLTIIASNASGRN
jgi:hypothetical protein